MDVDVRKVGIWMVVAGGSAMGIGIVADTVRHADDPDLVTREGVFDLGSVPHALFFGGIAVAVLGVLALAFGDQLYRRGARVTTGRRLAQVGAPLAALVLVGGCAAAAAQTSLSDGRPAAAGASHDEGHAGTESAAATGAGTMDHGEMDHGEMDHGEMDHGETAQTATGHDETAHGDAQAIAPKPYDPNLPIDLGGVPGVTPEQQARAENLIAVTLSDLPQFADYKVAEGAGYRSIGDAVTGDEHFINVAYFDDGRILDPDYPESLVYEPDRATGGKKLVAAMFMLAPNQTLDDVPDIGGPLTQWHIHDNLCFTAEGRVAGITSNGGPSAPGLNKGSQAPMIHVWITPNKCGPFAALEGVGAGQLKPGETRLCDTAHGHSG